MSRAKGAKRADDPVTAYARSVAGGKIIAGQLVKMACERHLHDLATGEARGLRFDAAAAAKAIQFFGFLKHSKGQWANRAFELRPWQRFIVGAIFGWKRRYGQCTSCDSWLTIAADGTIDCVACDLQGVPPADIGWFRRFQRAYIEVARKNGKTTLLSAIGLLLAFLDNEAGAEVYAAATKRDQAKICWSEAKRMVLKSPALRKRVKTFAANLSVEERAQKFEPLGADQDNMDGLNVHGGIIDEYHAHKTSGIYDVLDTATGARRQPLIVTITTAGNDRQSPCWKLHEYIDQLLRGVFEDDGYFGYIASLDEGDDWKDPAVWAKANPNLGVTVTVEYLRQQVERATRSPALENSVKQKLLDIWTQQVSRWISLDLWDENAGAVITESALKGRTCYGGLDLGRVHDMTAWCLGFPSKEDPELISVLWRFWCPESRLYAEENRYRGLYQQWVREGWLRTTPGQATDYGFVREQILEDAAYFGLVDMNVDRLFQAHQLATELADELGEDRVAGMGQGFLSMAAPMQELMRRLLLHKVHHGGNPVARWMADNMSVRMDAAGSLKPDKEKSEGLIDGMPALLMVLDRAMRHQEDRGSVYDRREVRELG